jgi:uncharacterized phage protein gp47/JayE
MSLPTPTLADVNANILAQLEAALGQTLPLLPKSFTRVLAKALAAVFVLLYKYAGFIFLQIFVSTASIDETTINGQVVRPLVEWGRLIGVGDPNPATRAELTVEVSVQEQTGKLSAGDQLLRDQTGVIYAVVADVLLDADIIYATVQAVDDSDGNLGAGEIGNLSVGDELSFANPLPYVERVAVVSAVVTTAVDAETPDEYRARVVARFQAKPQGGAYADYRVWGSEVDGVTYIGPYTGDPGRVNVYVGTTNEPDGVATVDQLDAVSAAIELDIDGLASRRPATALARTFSIYRTAFDLEVTGLAYPDGDLATLQADIQSAVDEHLRNRQRFIVGLDVLPDRTFVSSAEVGGIIAQVVAAAGASFTTFRVLINGGAVTLQAMEPGQTAKLGTTTYP